MIEAATVAAAAFSGIALLISGYTLWLTSIRRGKVKMTRPTTIFLGPDSGPGDRANKVTLGFLLYSTARSGRVVESMFVRLKAREVSQNFPIWVHDIKANLARGAGVFVGPEGVGGLHHFLLTKTNGEFRFSTGEYNLQVVARLVGDPEDLVLSDIKFTVSTAHSEALGRGAGVHYDWGGDHREYLGWVDEGPEHPNRDQIEQLQALLEHRSEN